MQRLQVRGQGGLQRIEQSQAARMDLAEGSKKLAAAGIRGVVNQDIGKPHDVIQGRAQFVAKMPEAFAGQKVSHSLISKVESGKFGVRYERL